MYILVYFVTIFCYNNFVCAHDIKLFKSLFHLKLLTLNKGSGCEPLLFNREESTILMLRINEHFLALWDIHVTWIHYKMKCLLFQETFL